MPSLASHLSRATASGLAAVLACAGSFAALTAGQLLAASAAHADVATAESYPFPPSGQLTVQGHGWGHGEGMSQEGAKQAATLGYPATAILGFYFPGATFGGAGEPPIRVALTDAVDGSTAGYQPPSADRYQCSDATARSTYCTLTVVQTAGLVVTDAATGAHPDAVAGVDEWGVKTEKDGLRLRMHTGKGWADATVAGKPAVLAGPVTFAGPTTIRVDWGGSVYRDYRGQLSVVRTDPGSATAPSRMIRLATMSLDDYVRGVVYEESPSSWPLGELEAQAIAARSYADSLRLQSTTQPYDVCDSDWCQVFGGTDVVSHGRTSALEPDPTKPSVDPVAQTADTVMLSGGQPLFAQYSASNGGWTAGGDPAYGPVRPDPWDAGSGDPYGSWTGTISATTLAGEYGFSRVSMLTVTSRDGTDAEWGGRVRSVRLDGVGPDGKAMAVVVSDQGSLRFGLRSTYWKPQWTAPTISAPATAKRGSTVTVTGHAMPGAEVDVWFHKQNTTGWSKRRTLTAGADGSWQTTYVADVDYRLYGTSQGLAGPSALVQAKGTTLAAPKTVAKGKPVRLSGAAAPSASVAVLLHRKGVHGFVTVKVVKADRYGRWKAAVTETVRTQYLARSAGVNSPVALVVVG